MNVGSRDRTLLNTVRDVGINAVKMLLRNQVAGKWCIFSFQLENGGDMAHVKDLSTQGSEIRLLFNQVLTTRAGSKGKNHPTSCLVRDLCTMAMVNYYLWQDGQGRKGNCRVSLLNTHHPLRGKIHKTEPWDRPFTNLIYTAAAPHEVDQLSQFSGLESFPGDAELSVLKSGKTWATWNELVILFLTNMGELPTAPRRDSRLQARG